MNDNVDFSAPAELFPAPSRRRRVVSYQRFGTLSEAVRYAVEELKPELRDGAFIECDEIRYGPDEIDALYLSSSYPLSRKPRPGQDG